MDYNSRLELSFYREIATINEAHQIYIVQHIETKKIFVKKILSVYNISVYRRIMDNPVNGTPRIYCIHEEGNELILIEEYISGNTLSELLSNGQPMSDTLVTDYVLELCDILESLHSFDPPIIHRDIKPSNIIITPGGHVVLIDLNAARSNTIKEEDTVLLGTKGYAAPEQYGFGSSNIQTDIYAIGMLLNTMLLGKFSRDIAPDVHYHQIIECCTKMNPTERFNTISELKYSIEQSQQGHPMSPKKEHRLQKLLPPGFRTHSMPHMLTAIPVYALVFWLSFSLEVKNTLGIALWLERITCLLIFLSIIACITNYMNIQRVMPLCSNKNRYIRLLGVILLSLCITLFLFFILVYAESVAFK